MKLYMALCMSACALIGCNSSENSSNVMDNPQDHQSSSTIGHLIKEFKVGKESIVRFTDASGEVTVSLQGHVDEIEANKELEKKLFNAESMEAAYRAVDSKGPIPEVILNYDKRPNNSQVEAAPPAIKNELPASLVEKQASNALEKSANHADPNSDNWWDWQADADWWNNLVGPPCGWHESITVTNVPVADNFVLGWKSKGYLMAAGHTYGASAIAFVWNGSYWLGTNSTYLEPRHYIIWSSNDRTKKYRRYQVFGWKADLARVHWGIRWDTQPPGSAEVPCQ